MSATTGPWPSSPPLLLLLLLLLANGDRQMVQHAMGCKRKGGERKGPHGFITLDH